MNESLDSDVSQSWLVHLVTRALNNKKLGAHFDDTFFGSMLFVSMRGNSLA